VNVNGVPVPKTEIHIGVACPSGVTCPEGERVKLAAHWVCPTTENPQISYVCKESDFILFTSVDGKITLDPNGNSSVGNIPTPPCPRGYLIAWVINTSDQALKFDGLIGDAVLRLSNTAESAYNGVPVQAADTNPADTGQPITTGSDSYTGQNTLVFDGAPGHYAELTGQLTGDVRFTDTAGPTFSDTYLILLTLDVQSNFPNNPTFVGINFYNANQVPTSTSTNFICWEKVEITSLNGSLNQTSQTTAEGMFVTNQAVKFAINGVSDSTGPATLLGLVLTTEGASAGSKSREYLTAPYNNGVGVPTQFAYE
jgi:hypothetical protein